MLIVWCYINFVNKNYIYLLFSIPFWIGAIAIARNKFFKSKEDISVSRKFDFKIPISILLIGGTFVIGVFLLFFGIKDVYDLNQQTKNYVTTNGYYKDYDIYDESTYRLNYIYVVDNEEYSITTNYGTNHIPQENSVREVKYNSSNPEEAVLVGANSSKMMIFMGVFFMLGSFTFILLFFMALGYFDKFKIDILGAYIGIVFIVVGIGVILFQNGTTMSLIETINSFGLLILIPIVFIAVGIWVLIKSLFFQKKKISSKKK